MYEDASQQNYHFAPISSLSKFDRLSINKGGTRAKYKDRARDYYRYNILYNRLA